MSRVVTGPRPDSHAQQMHAAETRLLYENASVGIVAAILIASVLAYAEWAVTPSRQRPHLVPLRAARLGGEAHPHAPLPACVTERRRQQSMEYGVRGRRRDGGSRLGAGAFVLYPASQPMNEVFLVFVVGGVMLGGASLLAARPEAFLTFLLPTGLAHRLASGQRGR